MFNIIIVIIVVYFVNNIILNRSILLTLVYNRFLFIIYLSKTVQP